MRWNSLIVTSLSVLVLSVACGKDSPTTPSQPEPARITITPASVSLSAIGQNAKLTATVYSNDNTVISGATLSWSSGNTGVATVSAEGLVTAVSNGTAQITARAGSASQSIQVSVMQEAGRIVIEPDMVTLMSLGETVQLTASVLDRNDQPVEGAAVTWTSGDEAVATVDEAGLVTAVSNGTAQITARAGSASQSIQVSVMQEAGRIVIEPDMVTLMSLGETVQLTASVLDRNDQPVEGAAVTWTSGDEAVATVDEAGLVTAVSNGTAQITARAGSASQSIQVSVMQEAGRIVIEPDMVTLMSLGETVQLTASVLDRNDQPVEGAAVTWTSGDEAVATVDEAGLVTAVSNGTAQITARAGSASQSIQVSVMQEAGRIVIEPDMVTLMSLGDTVQLTASVLDRNEPVEGTAVTWMSGDEAVATVDEAGLVTAVSNGTAQITARSGSASQSIQVSVMQEAGRIVIEPDVVTLMSLGDTVQLTASVLDRNDQPVEGAAVTWTSGDEAVASVDEAGLVTAVSNGTAQITAQAGNASQSIQVSVMQEAGRIVIEPDMVTLMSLGDTVQLTASVLDRNDQPVEGAAVTVDEAGLVTAVSNGTAQITARSGSASQSIQVSVMQEAGRIVIEPDVATLMSLGDTVQLTASVLDRNDQPVEGAAVTWTSGDEAVATVDEAGLVTAVSNGTAQITARSGSASQSIQVSVMQEAGRIVIEPDMATLMSLGDTVQLTASVLDRNDQPVESAVVTWMSGDEAVATVDEAGLVTAVSNGTAQITARSGSASQSIQVSVMQEAGRIVIEPDMATLFPYGFQNRLRTAQLSAVVYDENGHEIEDTEVSWSSGDEGLATVDDNGLVTLNHGQGTAQITARSGDAKASITVKVLYPVALESSSPIMYDEYGINPFVLLDAAGQTVSFSAIVYDENGHEIEGAELSWSSDDEFVATVDAEGTVTAAANGMTNINVRVIGDRVYSGHIARVKVIVDIAQAGVIAIKPPFPHLDIGHRVRFTATEFDENGEEVIGSVFSWSSDDEAVVTVDEAGLVTAVSYGTAQITAQTEILSASVTVTVSTDSDRAKLIKFYNETGGENWRDANSNKWLSEAPISDWSGAKLDEMGRVRILERVTMNLTGSIPPVLAQLSELRELKLWRNQLTGSIPPELGQLVYLEDLNLGTNQLTGSIPTELGQLVNLTNLDLWRNQLSGSIPPELGQLVNLEGLDLSRNPDLSGPLPVEMINLTNLNALSLGQTQLCVPQTTQFDEWLAGMQYKFGISACESP